MMVHFELVAATLIERASLPQCSLPEVADNVHFERLNDMAGVWMGLMALRFRCKGVAMSIVMDLNCCTVENVGVGRAERACPHFSTVTTPGSANEYRGKCLPAQPNGSFCDRQCRL